MSSPLNQKKCVPCTGKIPPLKGSAIKALHSQLPKGWEVVDEQRLKKEFKFKNFQQALNFTNVVGKIAEEEGHHPDIFLSWGKVVLEIWTHKINGLTESDFILASKCDQPSSFTA
jgi:4a-hydroxytetrahydrobiopterin dehydratase